MHSDLESIVCKFGGDPAICLREEAICAKVYRQTDRRTDDGRRAIALAHSWNELINLMRNCLNKAQVRRIALSHERSCWKAEVVEDAAGILCHLMKEWSRRVL